MVESYYKKNEYKSIILTKDLKTSLDNFKYALQADRGARVTFPELLVELMLDYDIKNGTKYYKNDTGQKN